MVKEVASIVAAACGSADHDQRRCPFLQRMQQTVLRLLQEEAEEARMRLGRDMLALAERRVPAAVAAGLDEGAMEALLESSCTRTVATLQKVLSRLAGRRDGDVVAAARAAGVDEAIIERIERRAADADAPMRR